MLIPCTRTIGVCGLRGTAASSSRRSPKIVNPVRSASMPSGTMTSTSPKMVRPSIRTSDSLQTLSLKSNRTSPNIVIARLRG
jgi:hypothetical protein